MRQGSGDDKMIDMRAAVRFNEAVAKDLFLMGLAAPAILHSARPGQFVMLGLGEGVDPLLRRPFSICGRKDEDTLLILYRIVGRGTALLARLGEGVDLPCLGPLGRGFNPPEDGGAVVAVAGGIGIAPLVSLMQSLNRRPCECLIGCRTAAELVPLDGLVPPDGVIRVITDDGSSGRRGLVTDLLEERLGRKEKPPGLICACGPQPMLREVARLAAEAHVSCQVSLEARMACGVGACQGCVVAASAGAGGGYLRVCREGPVFDAEEVDWGRSHGR